MRGASAERPLLLSSLSVLVILMTQTTQTALRAQRLHAMAVNLNILGGQIHRDHKHLEGNPNPFAQARLQAAKSYAEQIRAVELELHELSKEA